MCDDNCKEGDGLRPRRCSFYISKTQTCTPSTPSAPPVCSFLCSDYIKFSIDTQLSAALIPTFHRIHLGIKRSNALFANYEIKPHKRLSRTTKYFKWSSSFPDLLSAFLKCGSALIVNTKHFLSAYFT